MIPHTLPSSKQLPQVIWELLQREVMVCSDDGAVISWYGFGQPPAATSDWRCVKIALGGFPSRPSSICPSCKARGNCEQTWWSWPITLDSGLEGALMLKLPEESDDTAIAVMLDSLTSLKRRGDDALLKLAARTKQLEEVVEAVSDGILAIDADGRIICCNEAAKRLLKYPQRGPLIGEYTSDVFPGAPVIELLKTGRGYTDREIFRETPYGQLHHLSTAKPIMSSGRVIGTVVVLKDILDVHRLVQRMSGNLPEYSLDRIIGKSPAICACKDMALRLAKTDSNVLIQGETGVGKEIFARAIHASGPRRDGPFIAIDCGAIPDTLLESELFGYKDRRYLPSGQTLPSAAKRCAAPEDPRFLAGR